MTYKELYIKYLKELKNKLIQKYDELGLRASGEFENELEYKVEKDNLKILGAPHSYYMDKGRASGGFPPISTIEDWIENKDNLPPIFKEKKKQFAFLIARKIANEGIQVPNKYNKGHVVDEVVNSFLAEDIHHMIEEFGIENLGRIRASVANIFKQVA